MVLPDVNVLVNAFRDDMPQHDLSAGWIEKQINGPAAYGMADRVVEGFIRIVTHPRGFHDPAPIETAVDFARGLTERSNCVRVTPGGRQWELFLALAIATKAGGNSVADAWLAALAIESGSEWITWDKGFARYPDLRWSTPASFS
jgi:toxin-antitoxin system PIN domain toxin